MRKRLVSIVLVLCMMLCLFPVSASAANNTADLLTGVWEGHYTGQQNGKHIVREMVVQMSATYDTKITGRISIITDGDDCGWYYFEGVFDEDTKEIEFRGNEWIYNPENFSFANYNGSFDLSLNTISGLCDNDDDRPFVLTKISSGINDAYSFSPEEFIGTWEGEYDGHHNSSVVRRHCVVMITECSDDGDISGQVIFSPLEGEQYPASGSYYFAGKVNFITGYITYQGHTWIDYPKEDEYDNWDFAKFDGHLNLSDFSISGNVEDYSNRTFNLTRFVTEHTVTGKEYTEIHQLKSWDVFTNTVYFHDGVSYPLADTNSSVDLNSFLNCWVICTLRNSISGPVLVSMELESPGVDGLFVDVHESDWFAPYVLWAIENGITNGTSINTFSPNDTCTVAQILTFLWRAKGSADPGINNPFSDVKESDYFYKPALWAYKNGLVSGSVLNGDTPCTRAATVTYLWKLAGKPVQGNNPFSDVPNNADYAQAVAWAVNQGVTTGTSTTTFSPDQTCTRAQIVTFLYRYVSLNIPDPKPNPGISENPDIFNKETSFWGDVSYVYNGTELRQNRTYNSVGDTVIGNMTIPAGAKVRISGDLEITGHISLSSSAELSCDGNLTVSSDGIIDLSSGGTISCDESFTFDSATDHKQYLTAGLIEVGDNFESKRNFYASGSNEVHVLGYRVHTINMWDKWVNDDQYFNIFRVVDHGIEVLDVEEPFRCNAENGFLMDDWSWLKVDYYGSDFEFVGVSSPSESLKGVLQTGLMLAIASEGNIVEFGGIEYIGVDADEFVFSVYSPQQKQVITYTLEDISVTGLGLTTGKVATGQFKYNGRLYGFAPSPELSTQIWEDFKDTATILAITEVGDVYLDAYKNIVKSLISDVLPDSLQDAFQITSMMEENSEIFENYQTLSQIDD